MALNAKQRAFLNAMLSSQTIEQATEKAGISKSTSYKYLSDPEFMKEYRIEQRKVTDAITSRLLQLGTQAVETLEENLNDFDATPTSRNTTAKTILDYIYRSYEQTTIIDRIEELEKLLSE